MKQNVQRTLAIELQKLSVQFRKQQKSYLNKLRKNNASSSSFSLLDEAGTSGRDEDFDPGFSEIQVMSSVEHLVHVRCLCTCCSLSQCILPLTKSFCADDAGGHDGPLCSGAGS